MNKGAVILLTILQMLSSIKGNENTADNKKVVCYYGGLESKQLRNVYPEDLDASICTHIVYMRGGINTERLEINFDRPFDTISTEGRSKAERLLTLNDANPSLKILLFVSPENMSRVLDTEDKRIRLIKNAVEFLNETRFDGLEFPTSKMAGEVEELSTFYCSMQAELDKYGYILSTLGSDNLEENSQESVVERFSRCSTFITILTIDNFLARMNITRLSAPINKTRETVDRYIEKGYPANKLLITMATFGSIYTLTDPKQTGVGAFIDGPGTEPTDYSDGFAIFYYQAAQRLNDTKEGWTLVREDEADSPYAYSKTGKWLTFEDPISAAAKARYILEKDLGGALFFILDMSDADGLSGTTFPIIRAVSDTFRDAAPSRNDNL